MSVSVHTIHMLGVISRHGAAFRHLLRELVVYPKSADNSISAKTG